MSTTTAVRTCSIGGCKRGHYARGWCESHYGRWYRHGDPLWFAPPPYQPPANPWSGQHPCPTCGSADWTMPWGQTAPGEWLCIAKGCPARVFTP